MITSKQRKLVVYRIQLTRGAKAQLVDLGDRLGVPQATIMSRLMNWFCRQRQVVRSLILGLVPKEYAPQVARSALAELN